MHQMLMSSKKLYYYAAHLRYGASVDNFHTTENKWYIGKPHTSSICNFFPENDHVNVIKNIQ